MKRKIVISILLILYLLTTSTSYANYIKNDLSNNLFRLHIIANSDDIEDQKIKYNIRNKFIEYMKEISSNANTKEQAIQIAQQNIYEFKQIAQNEIKQSGRNYNAKVEILKTKFPNKTYANVEIPAGEYDSIQVKLGKAEGHNWWCIMFPPLCLLGATNGYIPEESEENLNKNLSNESYNIIKQPTKQYKLKLKIIELFNK